MTSDGDDPFMARWSRKKREADDSAKAEVGKKKADSDVAALDPSPPAPAKTPTDTVRSAPFGEKPAEPERPLTEADFADVDFSKLDYQSDYGRFMQTGVPEGIRRQALQKLWHSDPIFTQVDPFQDYAGDYTDAAVAVPGGLIKTAYKLGQGFLSDAEAAEWDALGKPETPVMAATPIVIAAENPDQPEILAFLAASDAYMASLYPAESNHLVPIAALQQPNVVFLVARQGKTAVGCGAVVLAGDGTAEIKRMWVDPKARGQKCGRRLMDALIAASMAESVSALRLETGIHQPEAIALYRKSGFTEIGAFADYMPDALSLFMAKRLAREQPQE